MNKNMIYFGYITEFRVIKDQIQPLVTVFYKFIDVEILH